MSTYYVAVADDATQLADEVNRLIADGYQPIGGVAVAVDTDRWENERKGYSESRTDYTFAQAMLKLKP